jgi:hypothetical protein
MRFGSRQGNYAHIRSTLTREASMKLTAVLVISAFAAMPVLAQAQPAGPPANAPKPTKAEIQKIVATISADKTKTQQYCEIGKLNQQMAEADQKNDTKALETLGKQADDIAHKIGPEFVKFMDALDQADDKTNEGKELIAAVETSYSVRPRSPAGDARSESGDHNHSNRF